MIKIYTLNRNDYIQKLDDLNIHPWSRRLFGLIPRGFVYYDDIYINCDAFYINDNDLEMLQLHLLYHTLGFKHTWTGIMNKIGIIRLVTVR